MHRKTCYVKIQRDYLSTANMSKVLNTIKLMCMRSGIITLIEIV